MTMSEGLANLPLVQTARAWFETRSGREQVLIAGLCVIAAGGLLVIAVWRPLADQRAFARSEIARYDNLLSQVTAAGDSIRPGVSSDLPPASTADGAASHGLVIRRIEPDGEGTRVVLEDVAFLGVIEWIAELETTGAARLSTIEIERRPAPGMVNVRVTLDSPP